VCVCVCVCMCVCVCKGQVGGGPLRIHASFDQSALVPGQLAETALETKRFPLTQPCLL